MATGNDSAGVLVGNTLQHEQMKHKVDVKELDLVPVKSKQEGNAAGTDVHAAALPRLREHEQDVSKLSHDELIQHAQTLQTVVKELQRCCKEFDVKVSGLQSDKKILEQGFAETKNKLEYELVTLQKSQAILETEKQHFNVRLRDKDTAMKDLADKFADLAVVNSDLSTENTRLKNEFRQLSESGQNSRKELLSKKFKEVEDLYDELHKAQLEKKQLETLNKQAELMLKNQTEIAEKLQLKLESAQERAESQIKEATNKVESLLHENQALRQENNRLRINLPSLSTPFSDNYTPQNNQSNYFARSSQLPHHPPDDVTSTSSGQHIHHFQTKQAPVVQYVYEASDDRSNVTRLPHSNLTPGPALAQMPTQDLHAQSGQVETQLSGENKSRSHDQLYVNLPDISSSGRDALYTNLPPLGSDYHYQNLDAVLMLDDKLPEASAAVGNHSTNVHPVMRESPSSGNHHQSNVENLQPLSAIDSSLHSSEDADVMPKRRENLLEKDLDNEIEYLNDDLKYRMYESKKQRTNLLAPSDPNLVCPFCSKQHRVGEIQKHKKHVEECDYKDSGH